MVGRKGDTHLVIGQLVKIRPPAHTMSNGGAANSVFDLFCFDEHGTTNLMPPLFGKGLHIHPTKPGSNSLCREKRGDPMEDGNNICLNDEYSTVEPAPGATTAKL